MKALLFPGQGSQKPCLGKELYMRYPQKASILRDILGLTVAEICPDDTIGILSDTKYLQPILFAVCALAYDEYVEENGFPQLCAGHSLGEFAALYAGGALGFEDGIRLLKARGEIMSNCPCGSMAAVSGLYADETEKILVQNGLDAQMMVNFTTPTQTVLSGSIDEIKQAEAVFENIKGVAFVPLSVGGPFHSKYMEECAEQFGKIIDTVNFSPIKIPVVSAVTALPYDDIKDTLKKHMASPVRWCDCVNYILDIGAEPVAVYPVGPITGMTRSIKKERGKANGNVNIGNGQLLSANLCKL